MNVRGYVKVSKPIDICIMQLDEYEVIFLSLLMCFEVCVN